MTASIIKQTRQEQMW